MNAKILIALAVALSACGEAPSEPVRSQAIVIEGFTTDRGENVSFIVSQDDEGTSVIVRVKHPDNMVSTISELAQEVSALELWYTYAEGEPPAALWDAFIEQGGVMPIPPEEVRQTEAQIDAITTETLTGGEGDCSGFASRYTWSQKYVSGTVTSGVTAGLAEMERFHAGACNLSSNDATDTLAVYLDRWTSAISGWNTSYFSETIVRGEAVNYIRSETTCSYYQHRLRVVPSTVSGTVSYRYAGQWAEVTCGVIGGS